MDENERLVKAEQSASLLVSDLLEIQKSTDNLALEEIVLMAIEQVETIRCRLKRVIRTGQEGQVWKSWKSNHSQ